MKAADVSSLRMLRRARDRIDRDYADPIDIPALAAGAGYSREHFIRAFRTACPLRRTDVRRPNGAAPRPSPAASC